MFIVGCGYIGRRVAGRLREQGHVVTGLVQSLASVQALRETGCEALQLDLDSDELPPDSLSGQSVFYFAPPPGEGNEDTRMRRFLAGLPQAGQPARIVYISTTGVYGDCQGDWVDETAPTRPAVARSKRRWDAEQQLRAWRDAQAGELVILRVAGIYGPDKLPLARLRKGVPMVAEADAPWTNRIHAEDLVEVCLAAMRVGRDAEVYNVSDGTPGNMTDYFNQVAKRAGLAPPPVIGLEQAKAELSSGLLSYLAESRRLNNHKMLSDLGVELRYPDLQSGLAACFSA